MSEIKPGNKWPYHFRGTTYHYNSSQDIWWRTYKDGMKLIVKSGHERIIKELLPLKTEGGSFRITETGDVIAKVFDGDDWIPKFICEMDEPFKFEEKISTTPSDLKPGDLWPSFYDGARYSYLLDKIWWHNPDGPRQYIEQKLPEEIIMQLHKYKPAGGSFRITENGYVITLIQKQPLPNNIKKQWESLSDIQQHIISVKVESTDMLPIFIGRYHEGITLKEPTDWTKPLSSEQKEKMLEFIEGFSFSNEFEGMVPKNVDKREIVEEFLDDPEDFK